MKKNELLRQIPGVDTLLLDAEIKELFKLYPADNIKLALRESIDLCREKIINQELVDQKQFIISNTMEKLSVSFSASLKEVINGTGILLHTNLGRAPLGEDILDEIKPILTGYNNLEFDLEKGSRGSRYTHVTQLICSITGAEDALIVNNNAAALMLILRTFAKRKEVVISRSELIEIGGSFRLPSIMSASGCKMVEVGTTNKTHLKDYQENISERTRILLKVHNSNFTIKGFTKSVKLAELTSLAKEKDLVSVFDLGSGLLDKSIHPYFKNETDLRSAVEAGFDLICFSGDKLLGGPQAGIIVGSHEKISKLKKEQMTRALRVDKLTLGLLEAVYKRYARKPGSAPDLVLHQLLNRKDEELKNLAENFKRVLSERDINSSIEKSTGRFGGGTMPEVEIPSYSIKIKFKESKKEAKLMSEKLHKKLMLLEKPIVGLLVGGELSFNVLSIFDKQIESIAAALEGLIRQLDEMK